MKLYKFRSLDNFERVKMILLNKQFHLAKWSELNDPMEGYFYHIIYNTDLPYKNQLEIFLSDKSELKICSFSNTYSPVMLWWNYANEYKGIAIEISINKNDYKNLFEVKYIKNIPTLDFLKNPKPTDVLTKKIKLWSYEKEYRIIEKDEGVDIGNITGVYFGIRMEQSHKSKIKGLLDDSVKTYETQIDFDANKIIIK